jgi:hypothetical protein
MSEKLKAKQPETSWHHEISVYGLFGDVEAKRWDATEEELDHLHEQYPADEGFSVVIDRSWEEVDDER